MEKVFSFLQMQICSKPIEQLQAREISASLPTSSFLSWISYLAAVHGAGLGYFAFFGGFHISFIDCDNERKNCYSGVALISSLNNKICAREIFIFFHVVRLASLWSGSSYISWIYIQHQKKLLKKAEKWKNTQATLGQTRQRYWWGEEDVGRFHHRRGEAVANLSWGIQQRAEQLYLIYTKPSTAEWPGDNFWGILLLKPDFLYGCEGTTMGSHPAQPG